MEGASFIYREALQRYVPMRFGVRGRDMESTVNDAKRRVAKQIKLPEGVHLDWMGEYSELQRANRRFEIVTSAMRPPRGRLHPSAILNVSFGHRRWTLQEIWIDERSF